MALTPLPEKSNPIKIDPEKEKNKKESWTTADWKAMIYPLI